MTCIRLIACVEANLSESIRLPTRPPAHPRRRRARSCEGKARMRNVTMRVRCGRLPRRRIFPGRPTLRRKHENAIRRLRSCPRTTWPSVYNNRRHPDLIAREMNLASEDRAFGRGSAAKDNARVLYGATQTRCVTMAFTVKTHSASASLSLPFARMFNKYFYLCLSTSPPCEFIRSRPRRREYLWSMERTKKVPDLAYI